MTGLQTVCPICVDTPIGGSRLWAISSGVMHARAHITPPRRNLRADHSADAIPSRKRRNDTISPCGAQG